MSVQVPMDRPLSDEHRAYLLSRGHDHLVAMLDEKFGQAQNLDADEEEESDDNDYRSWTVARLRQELANRDLNTAGNKAELVARLEEDDEAESEED